MTFLFLFVSEAKLQSSCSSASWPCLDFQHHDCITCWEIARIFWQRSFLPQLFSYLYQCRWELCKDSCPVAYLPMESRGSRVTGGHFLPISIFRFVHCYSGCSKIAFQLAQIYSYLVWNVTFWGNWPLEECEGGLKGVSLAVVWGKWCWFRKEVD